MSIAEWRERLGPLGLGAAQLGNLYRETSDADAAAAVEAAWADGVRYFDTAPHYGLGLSERRLGAALARYPRDEFTISTKVGRVLEPQDAPPGTLDDEGFAVPATTRRRWDFSRDGILRSIEDSLTRLGMDRIDIAYLHDPDDHWEAASTTGIGTLIELREQGVVGAVGAGMNQTAMPARFIRQADVDVMMVAGRYTLIDRGAAADLLPLAAERGVGIVAAGVYNSGLLATAAPAAGAHFDYSEAPDAVVAKALQVAAACAEHGVDLPSAAIQFPLHHPAVVTVVVGARTAAQQHTNAARLKATVPGKLWDRLDAITAVA